MVDSKTQVTLELLDGAVLLRPAQAPLRLERKTAALLAYLALEGPTPRSALAGLLWPDSLETTARGNLRQLLRRLRDGAGADLVAGDDPLLLGNQVSVDAVQLELGAFAGDDAAVIAGSGELLEGMDFEDCSDLTDWLLARRESLSGLKVAALERLADASEQGGDFRAALLHAQQLLELDAVSEVAHRRVMRLHYLSGDRGAALRAYQRCSQVMQRELGVAPLPETTALARSIEIGQQLELPRQMRFELPLSVQRPPLLVGREPEWAALESAWEAGLGIAVSGEAGVGKSRLTLEFVASKGQYALVQGRPGDASVPYSTLARSLRQTLSDHPELKIAPWVRLELSRLIPSLTTETPPAISSDEGKLRFFESMAAALEPLIDAGVVALVIEDLQFADAASLEAGQYLATRFTAPTGARLRSVSTYRSGELRGDTEALIQQGVSVGQVALIDLKPLKPPQLEALLAGLGVALPSGLPAALGRHSGGNPLFALETLRSLIESGGLTHDRLTERLPVPKRLEALVAGRLERLTPGAQRLVRTASVAGVDFSLELAASVLGANVLDLSEALIELEVAQVMRDVHFAHDLLSEAAFNTVPAPIRTVLHRRIAEYLEGTSTEPARVAHHWLETGDERRAAPQLVAAAESAQSQFRLEDAANFLERAAVIFERHAQRDEEFGALIALCLCLMQFDFGERHERVTKRLLALAINPLERAQAHHVRAELLNMLEQAEDALSVGREGLREAQSAGDEPLQAQLHGDIGISLWTLERLGEAHTELAKALEFTQRGDDPLETAVALTNLAVVLDHLDRPREAIVFHNRAVALFEQNADQLQLATALSNLAVSLAELGLMRSSLPVLQRAVAIFDRLQGADLHHFGTLVTLACTERDINQYAAALDHFQSAFNIAAQSGDPRELYVRAHLARVYRELGAFELALEHAKASSHNPNARAQQQGAALLEQMRCLEALGQPFDASLKEAERLLKKSGRYLSQRFAALERSQRTSPKIGLKIAVKISEEALERELFGLATNALTRTSQHHLALGEFTQALERSSQVMTLLETYDTDYLYRGEALLAHFRALKASGDFDMQAHLERSLEWLLGIADHHVPPELRASFLNRNPINRAILTAATQAGLKVH